MENIRDDISKNENVRDEDEVLKLGNSYLKTYNLKGWKFNLDRSKKRAGACNFIKKKITVSTHFSVKCSFDVLKNAILHEIAHAIVGQGNGHNDIWKKKALEIGCDGKRCHLIEFTEGKYVKYCPKGCWKIEMHKKPHAKRQALCKKCNSPVECKMK
jgi:predicted SprT family Zn-dependent metalloprotease